MLLCRSVLTMIHYDRRPGKEAPFSAAHVASLLSCESRVGEATKTTWNPFVK